MREEEPRYTVFSIYLGTSVKSKNRIKCFLHFVKNIDIDNHIYYRYRRSTKSMEFAIPDLTTEEILIIEDLDLATCEPDLRDPNLRRVHLPLMLHVLNFNFTHNERFIQKLPEDERWAAYVYEARRTSQV
jgi:hypothetical protein